ncbi:glycosyltransferase [Thioalkalivibrio denitrificans]|uniref:Glycosyltransferase n=1 Tax=Thioalkalivibrio denitrificans TaxID=108003 RepID=A0A1V3ND41_9GAMM|nr:glycosyltransferase family 39 protein [Thioalkalivibrio denitrificans]OOG23017.1 glycosyltransferase [Thioalkalivibrio denitrificans]
MRADATPLERWLIPGLLGYFALQILVRATGSPVLDLDEAEQVVVTQWWLAGYSGQPPLYAWLQKLAFEVFGMNLLAIALLKNSLLFLTYLFTYLSARRLLRDGNLAVLATLSLLLIPQVVWESQRDLSHSVIVTTVAAASFYVLLRWLERPSIGHYLLVGLVFGLGILSKYNYAVFAAAAGCVLLTMPLGRVRLFSPRILLSAAVAAVVLAPHALWFWDSVQFGTRAMGKLEFGDGLWPWSGFGSLALAVLGFLTPLWLVLLAVFRRDFLAAFRWRRAEAAPGGFPPGRYLLFALALLAAMVLILGAAHFKDRWMLPILLLFPLYVFAALRPGAVTPARLRVFVTVCLVMPVLALLVMAGRVHEWPMLDGHHRYSYPYGELTAEIRNMGFERGLIVADRAFIAGNLRFRLPDSRVMYPGVTGDPLVCGPGEDLLVVWDADRNDEPPRHLRDWLSTHLDLDIAGADLTILQTDVQGAALGVVLMSAQEASLEQRC